VSSFISWKPTLVIVGLTDPVFAWLERPEHAAVTSTITMIELLARANRVMRRLRTPGALQAATAVHSHATGLITNDSVFERVEGLEALLLESLL
jgi:predicted nucleic acid-binding protein